MNGGTVARWFALVGAGVAIPLLVGGQANANDRSTAVACIDQQTGAWRASITFASIDVREGHPVIVTFGAASTTLSVPGPNGTVTLAQEFAGDRPTATIAWSVVRNGTDERAGVEHFTQPAGCLAETTTTGGSPPVSPSAPTLPPMTQVTTPPSPTTGAVRSATRLPVTGGTSPWAVATALVAVVTGLSLTRAARRSPDEATQRRLGFTARGGDEATGNHGE